MSGPSFLESIKQKKQAEATQPQTQTQTKPSLKDAILAARHKREAQFEAEGRVVVRTIEDTLGNTAPVSTSDPVDPLSSNTANTSVVPVQTTNSNVVQKPISAEEFTHASQPDAISDAAERQLRSAIQALVNSFNENKELVGSAVHNVMAIIGAAPHLKNNLQPDDLGLMVRGLRMAYGTVIQKKTEKVEKKQVKTATFAEIDDLMGGDFKFEA